LWLVVAPHTVLAGMPAPLPTPFTADKFPHSEQLSPWIDERLQALSFFIVAVLASAAVVRWLWRLLRHDWPALPELTYRGALAGTLLWGLVFVVVLTMISGARELMTPGAWRKQGWTYQLATTPPPGEPHFREQRRAAVEQLRLALLQYAALHEGHFPATASELSLSWAVPVHPGFDFLYVPGRKPSTAGEVLVFEPEIGDPERLVLLTNGVIGTMRTPELEAALRDAPTLAEKHP